MSLIDLRFSNVNPPASEPHRSIYSDIVSLPDPVRLGLIVRIFNYDVGNLYMRVDASNGAWTFTTNNLGVLGSGANMYRNLDQFGSRARPAAALTEPITVRLRAYSDAGYTILVWTFTRSISVVFIKSDDGSWTQDYFDNFDDGTVDGWAADADGTANLIAQAVAVDYVLSPAFSLKTTKSITNTQGNDITQRSKTYKTINTPNRNIVLAIANIRLSTGVAGAGAECWLKNMYVTNGATVLLYSGRAHDGVVGSDYLIRDRWIRIIVVLPKNTAVDLRIYLDTIYKNTGAAGNTGYHYVWMDDFTVISKN
ncbi:hypothetical protein MUP59_01980 [Candidatus Bathyarchaeota archaeon]|nr:hypothetical protein [Candidatus Bathyarchaeota archaeon]